MTATGFILDIASDVVYFHETLITMTDRTQNVTSQHTTLLNIMQQLLESFATMVTLIESIMVKQPTTHDICMPQHARHSGGAKYICRSCLASFRAREVRNPSAQLVRDVSKPLAQHCHLR